MTSPKKPIILVPYPTLRKVEPYPFPQLNLPECEHDLFDSIAQEHSQIAGTSIDLYLHNLEKSKRDPLYDEPVQRVFDGPFRIKGHVTFPDSAPEARMEGFHTTFSAEAWIARKELEDAGIKQVPGEGDVMSFWRTPFFDAGSVDNDPTVPFSGYFFDVVDVDEDGHLFDSPSFVGFKFTLKRRTEFTPERRITNT